MKDLKKVFKRGEYFQTFELLLEVHYEQLKNRWVYETFSRKSDKFDWVKFNADERKITPIIFDHINGQIENVINSSIVKL